MVVNLVNNESYGNNLWQVDISITMDEYDEHDIIMKMADWLEENEIYWWSYYDRTFSHNKAIIIWLFSKRDDAMLFELTWG